MAIYWPTPGFKRRTFKLCVLTRWNFNFYVRSSPLRGAAKSLVSLCLGSLFSAHTSRSVCLLRHELFTFRHLNIWGAKLVLLMIWPLWRKGSTMDRLSDFFFLLELTNLASLSMLVDKFILLSFFYNTYNNNNNNNNNNKIFIIIIIIIIIIPLLLLIIIVCFLYNARNSKKKKK